MNNIAQKNQRLARRKYRIRATITGTAERPRLSIFISNLHITAQVIDDEGSRTLAYVTTVGQKLDGTMTEKAVWVGTEIAKNAGKAKVKKIVFDRGGKQYHGRVKALAEAARNGGLEF